MSAYTYQECSRTDRLNDFERMDRHGASDHVCRITRQRAGVSASTLPLPPSAGGYNFSSRGPPHPVTPYLVPVARTDMLLRGALGDERLIDVLKVCAVPSPNLASPRPHLHLSPDPNEAKLRCP